MGHTHPSSTNMKHDGGIKHASAFKHVEENANPGEDAHVRLVVEALAPRLDQMGEDHVLMPHMATLRGSPALSPVS